MLVHMPTPNFTSPQNQKCTHTYCSPLQIAWLNSNNIFFNKIKDKIKHFENKIIFLFAITSFAGENENFFHIHNLHFQSKGVLCSCGVVQLAVVDTVCGVGGFHFFVNKYDDEKNSNIVKLSIFPTFLSLLIMR